jgi:hypothetical protein
MPRVANPSLEQNDPSRHSRSREAARYGNAATSATWKQARGRVQCSPRKAGHSGATRPLTAEGDSQCAHELNLPEVGERMNCPWERQGRVAGLAFPADSAGRCDVGRSSRMKGLFPFSDGGSSALYLWPGWAVAYGLRAGVMKTGQVFVSHTSDMARFPEGRAFVQAALDAVGRAGMASVDMRYFAAEDGGPADYCRARVRECEIFVG